MLRTPRVSVKSHNKATTRVAERPVFNKGPARTFTTLTGRVAAPAPAFQRTQIGGSKIEASTFSGRVELQRNLKAYQAIRMYAKAGEKVVVNVPNLGDSVTDGDLGQWLKAVGDAVRIDDVVGEIETAKVVQEVRSPENGVVAELFAKPGDKVFPGKPLFAVTAGAAPEKKPEAPKAAAAAPAPEAPKAEAPKAAPVAAAPAAAAPAAAPVAPAVARTPGQRTEKRVPLTRIRAAIAENMKKSQNTAASLTTFQEADLSNLIQLRNEFKDDFQKKHGVKLGFMSAFVKASATALRESPIVNAFMQGNEIVYHDYVDICVAVATPKGLVVPVLRDADTMSFADVEKSIADLANKARNNQLTREELTGGTFTVSNGGVYGSLMGTPILNPPQSAILGMHNTVERPVVVNGKIEIRPMMYLALTYDHRIIDGKEAVTFLRRIKEIIEEPRRLILDV